MGCATSVGRTRERSRVLAAVSSLINPGPRSVVTSYYFNDFDGNVDALVSPGGMNEITNSIMGSSTGTGWGISNAVSGSTTSPATNVLVNGLPSTLYADNSFYAIPFSITNGPNTYAAIAWDTNGDISSNSSTVYAILTNGFYAYDQNGNLTNDGYKSFAFDDENQLIGVWVAGAWSNSFAYDGKMRRRIERDYSWNAGTGGWQETNEVHFIYDGNLVVEERNASNVPLVSYTRGNDLSGTFQGAGGIGGLLARTTYGQELPGAPTTAFYHADGNGNITALMYPNQQLAAKYLYDPFGNMLAMSGPLRNFNKYRFSSKEWNDNSGLYYYLYRFYDAGLQRWPNRDPMSERGFETLRGAPIWRNMRLRETVETIEGPDLYEFVENNPDNYYDKNGLLLGQILNTLQNFACPHLGSSACKACCLATAQGALIIDGIEAGGVAAGSGGTAIAVGIGDFLLSSLNDFKSMADCMNSCPCGK
jgi:RHS repeat-associated protein